MTTTAHARERRLLEEVQRATCAAFPHVPAGRVHEVVDSLWAKYDDARIREFIPLLVVKQAREALGGRARAGADGSPAGPGPDDEGYWATQSVQLRGSPSQST